MAANASDEQRTKLLAKLNWLIERSKTDYKGNPPAYTRERTLRSVEHARVQRTRARAGDADFLPFTHTPAALAASATPLRHLRRVDQSRFAARATTPSMAAAESVRAVLCWQEGSSGNGGSNDTRVRDSDDARAPAAATTGADVSHTTSSFSCMPLSSRQQQQQAPLDVHSLNCRPRHERAAVLHAAMLARPRFTRPSASYHAQRWSAASQQLPSQRQQQQQQQQRPPLSSSPLSCHCATHTVC